MKANGTGFGLVLAFSIAGLGIWFARRRPRRAEACSESSTRR
jgi:hypothetical protein